MAKKEIKGNEFTRCDAFWQPENEGESFTGVLIDVNKNLTDNLSGKIRPLYIFVSLGVKGEKCNLVVPKNADSPKAGKSIPNEKGIIIGVNDTYEIATKIGEHLDEVLGHEVTITFTEKEPFKKKGGGQRELKRFKVMYDDVPNKEFGSRAVRRNPVGDSAGADDAPDDIFNQQQEQ